MSNKILSVGQLIKLAVYRGTDVDLTKTLQSIHDALPEPVSVEVLMKVLDLPCIAPMEACEWDEVCAALQPYTCRTELVSVEELREAMEESFDGEFLDRDTYNFCMKILPMNIQKFTSAGAVARIKGLEWDLFEHEKLIRTLTAQLEEMTRQLDVAKDYAKAKMEEKRK